MWPVMTINVCLNTCTSCYLSFISRIKKGTPGCATSQLEVKPGQTWESDVSLQSKIDCFTSHPLLPLLRGPGITCGRGGMPDCKGCRGGGVVIVRSQQIWTGPSFGWHNCMCRSFQPDLRLWGTAKFPIGKKLGHRCLLIGYLLDHFLYIKFLFGHWLVLVLF